MKQDRMCGMTCPYGRSGARAVCLYTGGVGCGALVLVAGFVGAGQVVLPGFTFGQSLRSCPVGAGMRQGNDVEHRLDLIPAFMEVLTPAGR